MKSGKPCDMSIIRLANAIATVLGILALMLFIVLITYALGLPDEWRSYVGLACIFLVPVSFYFWFGAAENKLCNPSASGWLTMSALAAAIAGISWIMDCGLGALLHPRRSFCDAGTLGIGFLFTVAAGGASALCFASAVRSGILMMLTRSSREK
jgi:hypothetical protein